MPATGGKGFDSYKVDKTNMMNSEKSRRPRLEIILVISSFVLVAVTVCTTIILSPVNSAPVVESNKCFDICRLTLVETIPDNVTYPDGSVIHMDTFKSWSSMIDGATSHINIGSSYWTMRQEDVIEDPSAWKGEEIFRKLLETGQREDIEVRIAQNNNSDPNQMKDTQILENENAAEVRTLDFEKLGIGGGILHTKMWLVDDKHFYVGSANLDWRALTQVKEMGIMVSDCDCMGRDLQKVFTVYWMMGKEGAVVPSQWPPELDTDINMEHPVTLEFAGLNETMYISVAPPQFLPNGRTSDLDAVLNIIDSAQEFIYIALMDYFPTTLYMKNNIYWPIIDDRLRAAAFERGVQVRLMPAWWKYSRKEAVYFLRSLDVISPAMKEGSVEVRLFEVPVVTPEQEKIPYSRVNHNKYMVTETTALIGTSNWSGDYFIQTAGVSVIVSQTKGSSYNENTIHVQLKKVFERDWNSPYAKNLTEF